MDAGEINQHHTNNKAFIQHRDSLGQDKFIGNVIHLSLIHFQPAFKNITVVDCVLKDNLDFVELVDKLRGELVVMDELLEHLEQGDFLEFLELVEVGSFELEVTVFMRWIPLIGGQKDGE